MSTPGPPDRSAKRHKGDGIMPPAGYPYGQPLPHGRYQQPPYGPGGTSMGPQSAMGPQSSYMYMQHGQYSNPPSQRPPWPHNGPPPGAMYGQRGGPSMTPDRAGYGPGYGRGPLPPMRGASRGGKPPGPPHVPPQKTPDGSSSGSQSGFQGGWGHPQGSQWSQGGQYSGGPPPSSWQGTGGSRMQQPPPGYGNPAMFNSTNTPPRGAVPGRPRPPSQEMIRGGYPTRAPSGAPGIVCQPIETSDMETMYHSLGVGPDDDGNSTGAGTRDSKDKGRGSYKCGRCGVPKKGHICPYQPKLSRRPGEPLPEMRSAAIQVEMDEFMTLRRLNLKIQGFPESYATEPFMDDDMVVGEPAPARGVSASIQVGPPHGGLMSISDSARQQMTLTHPQDPVSLLGSPIRSSPISDDPITA
ncbi:unnamed protein product [Cylindrotheca closterium]|uniref:Uncharacterized protein n=1 Tax=Cylindrotheca closterium TaxID=2856 RepID=A0AAD2PY20_9STRA|nr:unnamed protein product [Cylindrotheca closterium]